MSDELVVLVGGMRVFPELAVIRHCRESEHCQSTPTDRCVWWNTRGSLPLSFIIHRTWRV